MAAADTSNGDSSFSYTCTCGRVGVARVMDVRQLKSGWT